MSTLPYVVSASLEGVNPALLQPGAVEIFREDLDASLRRMGKDTVWVDAADLRGGMEAFCRSTRLPVVSLDDRYIGPDMADRFLGVSRAVDKDLNDAGYDARLGYPAYTVQLDEIGRRYAGKDIVVVDDVLFSGEMMSWLCEELERRRVGIAAVGCGIAIGEGAEKLEALSIPVESVISFGAVDDELVELDFTALPGSGRKVAGEQAGSLYFDTNYGRPNAWASIPDGAENAFCLASLERNLALLRGDVPISAFVGYDRDGTTQATLRQRLQEIETNKEENNA